MRLSLLEFSLITIAVMALGMGLVIMVMLLRQRRTQRRDLQRLFEQLDLVRTDLIMLSEQVDKAVPVASHTQARPPAEFNRPTQPDSSAPRAYEVAARLARSGASCDELMSACGLSRHEAGLLLRLHPQVNATAKDTTRPRLSVAG
jgi:hypothetical protein